MVKDIDGKAFGEKILDPNYHINLANAKRPSYNKVRRDRELLNQVRSDNKLKEQWLLLWKWRDINNDLDRIMFFKVQSFIRNPKGQKKRKKFTIKNDLKGFLEYVEKQWFIDPAYIIRYSEGYQKPEGNDLGKVFKNMSLSLGDMFSSLSVPDKAKLSFEMQNFSPWIVQASYATEGKTVVEVFNEKDYLGHYIESEIPFNLKEVFNDSNWGKDLLQIACDRYYKDPIIYLRINLKNYDTDKWYKIDDLIKTKIKEIQCKVQSAIDLDCRVWELALMIYDLDKIGLADNIIRFLIEHITQKTIDIQEKKKQAKRLIDRSILPLKDFTSKRLSL